MLIILCLEFASTFAFQAGRPVIIFGKFKGSLFTITIYFLSCITTHIWGLSLRWENSAIFPSSPGYLVVHFIQRTWALLYYFSYKRAMYRLGDNRYYVESDWVREQLAKHH
ncbi:uncharacterized protein DEA37_0007319 [Paragonimus westermani]|uniref:Transmembrane protein 138 n=1 Tax=Paragonimus westermani TaxID=34504 RepID=A0A5J4P1E9_9TREM|nr:uncharacterized protein DEA37_0007319 [Paragonimus westermani]